MKMNHKLRKQSTEHEEQLGQTCIDNKERSVVMQKKNIGIHVLKICILVMAVFSLCTISIYYFTHDEYQRGLVAAVFCSFAVTFLFMEI
jgi:hypothetical protein